MPVVITLNAQMRSALEHVCNVTALRPAAQHWNFPGPPISCRQHLVGVCSHVYSSSFLGFSGVFSATELRRLHLCAPRLMALVEHDAPVVSHVSSTPPVVSTAATTDEGTASAASGGQAGGSPPPLPAPASPPWNLDRINQRAMPLDLAYSAGKGAGAGVTIYVVDTGIRSTHAEFRRAGGGASRALPLIVPLISPARSIR